jgi:hypothetical protein
MSGELAFATPGGQTSVAGTVVGYLPGMRDFVRIALLDATARHWH